MEVHQHQDQHQQDQQQHQQVHNHQQEKTQQQQQHKQQHHNYAVQTKFQKQTPPSKKANIRLINAHISDKKLNQEGLLVHAINSVSCKNYGLTADLVEKYPYCDLAGLRYCDTDLKCIAREIDRSPEGLCLIRSAPLYLKGPSNISYTIWFRKTIRGKRTCSEDC